MFQRMAQHQLVIVFKKHKKTCAMLFGAVYKTLKGFDKGFQLPDVCCDVK